MAKGKSVLSCLLSMTLVVTMCPFSSIVHAETGVPNEQVIPASEMLDGADYKADELIVTFDDSLSNKKIENIVEKKDSNVEQIVNLSEDEKVVQVTVDGNTSMEETIEKFQQDNRVVDVQPNYQYKIHSADPYLSEGGAFYQYMNKSVKAEAAWDFLEAEGNKKDQTLVAVMDTGVDVGHEDLQANLNKVDDKYYVRTLNGEEIKSKDDSGDHGTHVTGIVGATYGNGKGGSGVASGHNNDLVDVMVIGTSPDGMYLYTFDIVNAIKYAQRNNVRVVNMSFGADGRDRVEEKALIDAYNSGMVLVAASGNDDYDGYSSPGSMKEVIGVNASAFGDAPSYYSNYGTASDIMAPGSDITSTLPGNNYGKFSGTSMASPVVCGVAALVLDANPNLSPAEVYNILCASTGQGAFDYNGSAYGLVDAEAAVKAAANFGTKEAESLFLKEAENGVVVSEGDDYCLEALVRPAEAVPNFTWESSDESVATVSSDGRIIGVAPGKCHITVRQGEFHETCSVTVKGDSKVESLEFTHTPKDGEICVGDYDYVEVKATPTNLYPEVYYESSDPSIAMVDEMGYVEGRAVGTATITAYAYKTPSDYLKNNKNNIVKVETTVTIKHKATNIKIDKSLKWIWVGSSLAYSGQLSDNNGHTGSEIGNNKIVWSVNNKTLASMDENGTLTAKKPGNVYVVAKQYNEDPEELSLRATRKLIIAKKTYKGKADYALKASIPKKKNRVKLSWKANPIASGYQIQFSTKKNGKYKTVKTVKSKVRKVTLKAKKKGYYRVRAKYVYNGKTKWFGYSNVVKAKPRKK